MRSPTALRNLRTETAAATRPALDVATGKVFPVLGSRDSMAQTQPLRVLDVGQCDMDHGNITQLLTTAFGAAVDRAHSQEEALNAVMSTKYDLVLVNRVFDADGSEGLGFIKQTQQEEATRNVPVMLVSNFEDAQESAIALGAVRGFGKSGLHENATIEILAAALHTANTAAHDEGKAEQ